MSMSGGAWSTEERGPGGLACVVMSVADQPGLSAAVRSLEGQSPRPEIVVVNSAGGDPAETLAAEGLAVRVISRPQRLLPGAARNLGVAATRERYAAFLAADCMAEPGWVAARLRAHHGGAAGVASAMTNAIPWSRAACASHLLLYPRRLPETAPAERLLYGVSYDRRLFDRLGLFREDLREGEDTDFNARVAAVAPIVWDSRVRTAHRNPTSLRALLRDQYARGRRSRVYDALPARSMVKVSAVKQVREARLLALRASKGEERRRLTEAMPLVRAGAAAFTAGLLASRFSGRHSRGTPALTPVPRCGAPPG
jgi:glycosyltransferase involved in cell wall biosynthesis